MTLGSSPENSIKIWVDLPEKLASTAWRSSTDDKIKLFYTLEICGF